MRVDIWSDVVCPWCYIGKRRFEAAVERLDDLHLEVAYRPFQLDPDAPIGSTMPVTEVYARKFGGDDHAMEIIDRVTAVAASEGIDFHLGDAKRANTYAAHRLIWWAGQPGNGLAQGPLNELLMLAYFRDGLDIGDHAVLADVAQRAGADADAAAVFLSGDGGADEVADDLAFAAGSGITAVPTFVVADSWAIPGAQDTEVFVAALRKLAAKSCVG